MTTVRTIIIFLACWVIMCIPLFYWNITTKNHVSNTQDSVCPPDYNDCGYNEIDTNNTDLVVAVGEVDEELATSNALLIEAVNRLWVNEYCGGYANTGSNHTISVDYTNKEVMAICNDNGSMPDSQDTEYIIIGL